MWAPSARPSRLRTNAAYERSAVAAGIRPHPLRRRCAPELHEDGAHPACAGESRPGAAGAARPHRSALRPGHERTLVHGPGIACSGHQSRRRFGQPCGSDRGGHAALRAGARCASAVLRGGGGRCQFDARLHAGRGQEGGSCRSCRSGIAQFRPPDAGGDQPARHRPDRGSPVHHRAQRRRQSASGRHPGGTRGFLRQRDDRLAAGQSPARAQRGRHPARARRRSGGARSPQGLRCGDAAQALECRRCPDAAFSARCAGRGGA